MKHRSALELAGVGTKPYGAGVLLKLPRVHGVVKGKLSIVHKVLTVG